MADQIPMTAEERRRQFLEKKAADDRRRAFMEKKAAEAQGGTQPAPTGEGPGFFENLRLGANAAIQDYVLDPVMAGAEALNAATMKGDFTPAKQLLERGARGAVQTVASMTNPQAGAVQQPQIDAVKRAQADRRAQEGGVFNEYFQGADEATRRSNARIAQDKSLGGKLTRGVAGAAVAALPAVATGVATGGSVPAIAATTALQSLGAPESAAANVALSAIPLPVGKVVAPILRRIRGDRAGAAVADSLLPAAVPVENEIEQLAMTGGRAASLRQPAEIAQLAIDEGNVFNAAEKSSVLETITALRKAGLLSGIPTHVRNVAGTTMFQLSDEAARVPGALADLAMSAITKRRTFSGPSLQSMAKSGYEAATKGVKEAAELLKNGPTPDDLAAIQLSSELNSGSKILDGYTKMVFRSLGAEDKVLKSYAFKRSLEDRARSLAATEVRQGKIPQSKYAERYRELSSEPTEDLIVGSIADAEMATFTNDNLVSKAGGGVKRALEGAPGGKFAQFAIDTAFPFTKTPTNIVARMLDYSPYGFGKNTYQVAKAITKGAFTAEEQRNFAQTFGRASIGSGLLALGAKLYSSGNMTGLFEEDDPSRRGRDEAGARPPGAIRIGDQWIQVTGFAPLGTLLALGATIAREAQQERTAGQSATEEVIGATLEGVMEGQPLLEGTKGLTDAGNLADRAGRFAGSFIPTAVSDVGNLIDPMQRAPSGEGFTAQVKARIPGLRQSLPPRIDALGRPVEDRATDFIDPTKSRTATEDQQPIIKELLRLDIGLSKVQKKPGEATAEYQKRIREFGGIYQQYGLELVTNPRYQGLSDALKKKAMNSLSERAKAQVNKGGDAQSRLNSNIIVDAVERSSRPK